MSYGVKYQSTFDPVDINGVSPVYTVKILKKAWVGNIQSFTVGATPVRHLWQTDDPRAPIKGSSLLLNIINRGSVPLSAFYDNEDDGFKIQLWRLNQLLFEGFVVQDESSEPLADVTHELKLSATDNLGLLKAVPLDQAPVIYIPQFSSVEPFYSVFGHTFVPSAVFSANLQVGSRITITGTTVDGVYTVGAITPSSPNPIITLNEIIQSSVGVETGTILVEAPTVFQQRMTLLSLIQSCLTTTGLELETRIYANIQETTQSATETFLKQTIVDSQTFLKNDRDYDDCYSVLTKILDRFNLTLFQAEGVWNIVRWDELRYYNNLIPGYAFSPLFILQGNVALNGALLSGREQTSREKTFLEEKVARPYKYVKETFNYKQPQQLLRNYNFQELGALRTQYTSGAGVNLITTYEYDFPWWIDNPVSVGTAVSFIRVRRNYVGVEIERYVVVKEDDIMSYKIEVNQGDTFTWSYRFKTNVSQAGPISYSLTVRLTDGTTTKYLREPTSATPGWQNGPGWANPIPTGENTNEWHTVEITADSHPIPFDGLLYVYLEMLTLVPSNETHFSDLRFNYTPLVNQSTKIIGHTHTDSQVLNIKNKEDEEIHIDDSPRNSIVGTLFTNTLTGVLQTKTLLWTRGHLSEAKKAGEIITFEVLFNNRVPRTILDGTLYSDQDIVSMLSVFTHTWFPGKYFAWGTLEIDYRHKLLTGTLWERWRDGEVDADLTDSYLFNYLYDLK